MMSGIRRSSPQSPPPITLPARAVATATPLSVREERVAVGGGDELRAGLAVAVGIPAALRLVLAVAPFPLAVLVDLVGGHVDRRRARRRSAARRRARSRCPSRWTRRCPPGRRRSAAPAAGPPCGSRPRAAARRTPRARASVSRMSPSMLVIASPMPASSYMRRAARRAGGVPDHFGAQALEPQAQPAALEAGVPGHEHSARAPERRVGYHVFHGACPVAQRSSRWFLSRSVSIAYQNPS